MQVNSVNNQSFKGKIKINGPVILGDTFAKKLERLKTYTYEPTDKLEIELKKLSDKMGNNKVYHTLIQQDGFSYVLTDEDAQKAIEYSIKSIYREIYRQDINKPNSKSSKEEKSNYIKNIVDDAEQIGEINCSFEVIA